MSSFYHPNSTSQDRWRALILFGRNTASYKFAFGKALLTAAEQGLDSVSLEQLAPTYTDELISHLISHPKQATAPSSSFLEACSRFNLGEISREDLTSIAVKIGFKDVVGAFQNLKGSSLNNPFYSDDLRESNRLILHDDLLRLSDSSSISDLRSETESRWRLVESAWSLGVSERILAVDADKGKLVLRTNRRMRTNITSCRDALNGYQKGFCFYCFKKISTQAPNLGEVDHFLPFSSRELLPKANIDGVWNLVLACSHCNGAGEKWDRLPAKTYLERLHRRNEFLIQSKHPLRESLINQTGQTERNRATTIQERYNDVAQGIAPSPSSCWEIKQVNPEKF